MAKTTTATVGGTPTKGSSASQYTSWMDGMLSNGGYTGAINSLLGGSAIGDPKSLTSYFQQMGQQGGSNLSPINYQAPNFNYTQLNQAPLSNQAMPNWMGTQFQQAQQVNPQAFTPVLQQAALNNQQYINTPWQNPNLSNNFQMNAGGIDPNSDYAKAIQQMVGTQQQQDVAALRERFTGTGSSAGSPAAVAESNLRAQSAPQLVNALSQANQTERGLNLQQMGLANQAVAGQNQLLTQLGLGQNQFNQSGSQFGANYGLQQTGLNSDIINQMNQLGMQGGQLGLQAAGLNADIVNQMNQLMGQQGLARNQFGQTNAQLGMQQTGMNADIMNQFQQMMLGQNQNYNQFNLANSGQDLQAQMANQQNMLANQQMMNQYGMGMGNLYQGFSGQNLQGLLSALGQMGGQYSQLLGLGTPQAQTVQKNTGWGNFLGSAGDITGMISNLAGAFSGGGGGGLSSMFSGGGGIPANLMSQTPQMSNIYAGMGNINTNPYMNPISQYQMPQLPNGGQANSMMNFMSQLNNPMYGSTPLWQSQMPTLRYAP